MGGDEALDSDADPAMDGMTETVVLESGETNNDLDAGILEGASLGDFVFEDVNGSLRQVSIAAGDGIAAANAPEAWRALGEGGTDALAGTWAKLLETAPGLAGRPRASNWGVISTPW